MSRPDPRRRARRRKSLARFQKSIWFAVVKRLKASGERVPLTLAAVRRGFQIYPTGAGE